ncbi:flavin reductase domain protein FMN-binding protein [Syntrophobotulus glycolicus DSM 8271]|uniref:Flavin reductase domain protein FMN-binding protein n=1 Tax=Syntrophobotulus glycolicus (strain DSM 8271 / FlGlyR) TaxID=645991 RepID=F0SVS8_SYNGF|nr:flavin reductase family protein [Syntrophobotulus glycolicus]ADY55634.1 flavin reductase domain protein FMN-binding protein [Syntrophobotulus glycolicus DSM 8271]
MGQNKEKVNLKISSTILSPSPAILVSCKGTEAPYDKDNIISIAMTSTLSTVPPLLCISLKSVRFSYSQIKQSGEYVINMVGRDLCFATDWCGVKSGRDYDKFKECNLTPVPIKNLSIAHAIAEAPISIGCKLVNVAKAGSYEVFIGEVVSVEADSDILDENGKADFKKFGLISYNDGDYYELGEHLGFLGYSIASPEVLKKKSKK